MPLEVLLQAFGYKHANLFMNRPHLWRLYQAVGGRPAEIRASWEVEAGRVWGKGFGVFVQVPPQPGQSLGGDEGYALIGTSNSVSHFPFGYDRVQLVMHPTTLSALPVAARSAWQSMRDLLLSLMRRIKSACSHLIWPA